MKHAALFPREGRGEGVFPEPIGVPRATVGRLGPQVRGGLGMRTRRAVHAVAAWKVIDVRAASAPANKA